MRPTVSIVTPTYNRAHFLKMAIESVLVQTYRDWELVVMDDGSTDSTRELVEKFQRRYPNIRYFYHSNLGLARTRARAIHLARGKYVTFLDDDDLFLPEKLEKQVKYLADHPGLGFVYSYADWIDAEGRYLRTYPERPAENFLDLARESMVLVHTVLIRKICFDHLGTFRQDLETCDDYEMMLRISRSYPIAFLPEKVALYRQHENNMSNKDYQILMDAAVIRKSLLKLELSEEERCQIRKFIERDARQFYAKAVDAIDVGQYKKAAFCYLASLRFDPFVGVKVSWGRFTNPVYRFLRPYLGAFYCGWLFLKSLIARERLSNANA